MKTELSKAKAAVFDAANLVYVKRLKLAELQSLVSTEEFNEIKEPEDIFALHNATGQRIAIVAGREAAFAAARAHDLRPRSVH